MAPKRQRSAHERKVTTKVADEVASEEITAYDQSHLAIYLRLLDAQVDGASREEMARGVLEIDPDREPDRAGKSVDSHLGHADWMRQHGYRESLARQLHSNGVSACRFFSPAQPRGGLDHCSFVVKSR